jgi:CheY-like chemotaxis protein
MRYRQVLLIDDDPDSNFVNSWILKKDFADEVIALESGPDALEYLRKQDNLKLQLPEVIFLDIRMPVMDGFGFLGEFARLSESIRESCRIIMLSSSFDKKDYQRAMDDPHVVKFINKPLTPQALEDI